MSLEQFLVGELFAFLLIFVRIGSGIMVMPGIGESYVTTRVRLAFALIVSLALLPLLKPIMPQIPSSPFALGLLMFGEVGVGLFFGLMARVIVSAMHTVGMVMSFQSSLASATMFDVSQASQGSAIGNFLSITAVLLIFVTDMHHLMLQGLVDSYSLFIPGAAFPIGDMANNYTRLVSDVFNVSIKLASPLIAMGLILYLGAGVLARLMPNMQIFFVIIPLQIQVSFWVIMITMSGMFLWYLDFVEERLSAFLGA